MLKYSNIIYHWSSMDIATLSAIVLAITSLTGSILAYRKLTLDRERLRIDLYDKLVEDLSEELERRDKKIEALEKADTKREAQILKLQLELNQARQRIDVLEEENESLRKKNAELSQEIEDGE